MKNRGHGAERSPIPLDENPIVQLAYAVVGQQMTLDQAWAVLQQDSRLARMGQQEIEQVDQLADSAAGQLPELAYALAALNYRAAQRLSNTAQRGRCTLRLGTLTWHRGQLDQAIPLLEEAANLGRQANDIEGECIAQGNLANVYYAQGQVERAIVAYRSLLPLAERCGNRVMVGLTYLALGKARRALGQLDQALAELQRGVQAAQEAGDADLETMCKQEMRDTYLERAGQRRQGKR